MRSDLDRQPESQKKSGDDTAFNFDGKWNLAIAAPGQTISLVVDIKQNGEVVTGTIETAQGAVPLTDGSYKDGVLVLKSDQPIALTFRGKFKDGFLSGSVSAPQGTTSFSGTKVVE